MNALLAIESSCDETAAAVVGLDGYVHSNVIATQIPIHARYGGVVPELASRAHLTALPTVVQRALEEAETNIQELAGVAVTAGPGLAGCLLVGLQTAKGIAYGAQIPLVAVNHIEAHIHAVFLTDAKGAGSAPPAGPYIALAVSGGHTSLYRVSGPNEMRMLGQTLDDAAGEAFDKVAKMMGLPYPGGVYIDRMAKGADGGTLSLPRPILKRGLDFSFSGLKTAARLHLEALGPDPTEAERIDLAASVQEAIVDVLCAKSLAACRAEGLNDLVVAGGVACNSRLRELIVHRAQKVGVRAHLTPARYCTDNAAMIGGLGASLLARGEGLEGEALVQCDIHVTRRPKS